MKKHKKLFNVFTGVLLVALLVIGVGWSIGEARSADRGDMVEVLIGFKGKPGPAEHRLIKSQGGKVTKELNRIDVLLVELPAHNVDKVIVALENVPNISFVEENGVMEAHIQTVPWGIARVFGEESYPFPTWNTSKGEGIAVAILDTGIDCDHEDLTVAGGTYTIGTTDYCSDGRGHGTHVAGTVVALDNDQGVVGVAPQIDLYSVKVLDDSGSGSVFTVAAGIDWVVTKGNIDIINMSLGGGHHQTLELAVKDAYEAGVLMVASAGNSGPRPNSVGYPAAYPEVIAVSATDINNGFASFSSRGSQVELTAPGVSILSTLPGNSYGTYNGTSMASPHVAGVAALVWATNPKLTHEEVRTILQETAENIGLSSDRQGYGLVRADSAVNKATGVPPAPEPEPEPNPEPPEDTMSAITSATNSYWQNRNFWRADVTIEVKDQDDSAIEGAEVVGVFGNNGSVTGLTNTGGFVTLSSGNFQRNVESTTFVIQSISHEKYTWNKTPIQIEIKRP